MKVLISTIAAGVLAAAAAPAFAATTYNIYDDFKVTGGAIETGAFTVGSSTGTFTGAVAAFTTSQLACGDSNVFCLRTGESSVSKAYAGDYDPSNSVFYEAGYVNLHPDTGRDTVVQFVAQSAATYNFAGAFKIHDSSPTGVSIARYAGATLLSGGTLTSGSSLFDFDVDLAAGETVSFVLGAAGNYTYDSTGFALTVTELDAPNPGAVPEPATWAMMILGFGGVGVTLRKRRELAA